jgi:hypothetical protein
MQKIRSHAICSRCLLVKTGQQGANHGRSVCSDGVTIKMGLLYPQPDGVFALNATGAKGCAAGDIIVSAFDASAHALYEKLETGATLTPKETNFALWLKDAREMIDGIPHLRLQDGFNVRGGSVRDVQLIVGERTSRYLRVNE